MKHETAIKILYKDLYIMVIEKPAGVLSASYIGCTSPTLLDYIERDMRRRGTFSARTRPRLVHRLDRDTSGVMIVALTKDAQKRIMNSWKEIVTERLYRAVCENPPIKTLDKEGLIDLPIAYNAYHLGFVPRGKNSKSLKTYNARTNYKVILQGKTHTLFELSLDTGRKNQIRAHLAFYGYTIAGDKNYSARTNPFNRLALHARTISFTHPYTNAHLSFEVKEPDLWYAFVKS